MMEHQKFCGHITAIVTIFLWGTTFISTKVLLDSFAPIEILFYRFVIGFIALLVIYPHKLVIKDRKQEIVFAGAGLCGVTLYFLFENIALTYTLASNVGVLVSISPFFTAFLAHKFLKGEKLTKRFFLGFGAAVLGILLIGFNGNVVLKLNPIGDILAILAAVAWAFYSILTKKISGYQYHIIQSTRHIFFYGLIFMIPALFLLNFKTGFERFADMKNLLNILYLGFGASAICFVSWNWALKILGAVRTSVYIYMVPAVTMLFAAIILKERITSLTLAGATLTLVGLLLSEGKLSFGIIKKVNDSKLNDSLRKED